MKMFTFIILSLLIFSCTANNIAEVENNFEITTTTTTQATEIANIEKPIYISIEMPPPFAYTGGSGNQGFNFPYTQKLDIANNISTDFAEYLGFTENEFIEAFLERLGAKPRELQNDWTKFTNIFTVMVEFEIPNEIVLESLEVHNNAQDSFATRFNDDGYLERKFTPAEIDAILSRDPARVLEEFATEQAIVIGDKAFAPIWLYLSDPEDYHRVGITVEMIEEKLELLNEFHLTDEAFTAFENKLSFFMGESVRFERRVEQSH